MHPCARDMESIKRAGINQIVSQNWIKGVLGIALINYCLGPLHMSPAGLVSPLNPLERLRCVRMRRRVGSVSEISIAG